MMNVESLDMEISLKTGFTNLECIETLETDISYNDVVKYSEMVKKIMEPIKEQLLSDFSSHRNPEKEFEILKVMGESARHKHTLVAFMNKQNRYSEIKLMKHTGVLLGDSAEQLSDRYINASSIVNPFLGKQTDFLATQGPLPATFYNFWRMVDQYSVKRIYMICKLEEDGRKKCDQYWPTDQKSPIIMQNEFKVELKQETKSEDGFKIERRLTFTNMSDDTVRDIDHIHIIGWADHDIPSREDMQTLYDMIDECIDNKVEKVPDLVHCSAGIGRTGTFIALYYLRRVFRYYRDNHMTLECSVFSLVRNLKEQRFLLINKPVQYRLLYTALADWINQK